VAVADDVPVGLGLGEHGFKPPASIQA
jgi:hypothetical protein